MCVNNIITCHIAISAMLVHNIMCELREPGVTNTQMNLPTCVIELHSFLELLTRLIQLEYASAHALIPPMHGSQRWYTGTGGSSNTKKQVRI